MESKSITGMIEKMGSAVVVWLLASCLAAAVFFGLAVLIGKVTGSGSGSCGPYGPLGGFIIVMMIGAIPVGILTGIYAAQRVHRHYLGCEKEKNAG